MHGVFFCKSVASVSHWIISFHKYPFISNISMYLVLRVFRGIPGDLRTLIEHVGVHLIFLVPRKQLTEFEKGKIIAWSEEGVSNKEIGRRIKHDCNTIGRLLRRFKAVGDPKRRFAQLSRGMHRV